MGTTLGNIHIYGQISDALIDALADRSCFCERIYPKEEKCLAF